MRMAERLRLPAILCGAAVALCAVLSHPVARIGIIDDWSYIKTVQVLALTGKVVYNAWGNPLLGWQMFWGAMFVKLLGDPFVATRMSVLVIAMATAFLVQRTLVRLGLREWNATLATLTFLFAPVVFEMCVVFFTDIPGLFATVLCLYACVRAVQAGRERTAIAWIVFAALGNAVAGSARQIAWIGLLVTVPATLWLLRRQYRLVLAGVGAWGAGVAIVVALMRWYSHQPYSIPEGLVPHVGLRLAAVNLTRATLDTVLILGYFAAPLTLMFLLGLRNCLQRNHLQRSDLRHSDLRRRASRRVVGSVSACGLLLVLVSLALHHGHKLARWLVPREALGGRGLLDSPTILGNRPSALHNGTLLLLTAITVVGLLAVLAMVLLRPSAIDANPDASPNRSAPSKTLSWFQLAVLLGPTTLAYLALIAPRSAEGAFIDRYLIFPTLILVILLTRYFQERVAARLPWVAILWIAALAAFDTACVHDAFAMYRARRTALDEILASGIPPTAIDGGGEFNGMTQVDATGYVNNPKIVNPAGAYIPLPAHDTPEACRILMDEWFPSIHPLYALSFMQDACAGPAPFAPVTYRTWLAPHSATVYVIRYAPR